jgi:hypothetical protein
MLNIIFISASGDGDGDGDGSGSHSRSGIINSCGNMEGVIRFEINKSK